MPLHPRGCAHAESASTLPTLPVNITLTMAGDDEAAPDDIKRHTTLYFSDGNLVVLAPSASEMATVAFRLHMHFLARHSVVFADMFAASVPGGDMYDGIPRVALPDDAMALDGLFGLLYNTT